MKLTKLVRLSSTQLIGFGLSGLTYAILVRPTVMVWPAQLVTVALYETLHGGSKDQIRQAKDRLRFFLKSFAGIFTWQFFPTVIAPTLSSIALLCIINNRSSIMRVLGSGYDGFGMFDFSLDWAVVGGTGGTQTFLLGCFLVRAYSSLSRRQLSTRLSSLSVASSPDRRSTSGF